MDYALHYNRIVDRARSRVLIGYVERHHVIPRCLGGTDAPRNIVKLTPEEHYVSHQLLVKLHPANVKLVTAAIMMAKRASGNKAYGWLRRRYAGHKRGKPLSSEHKRKIAESNRGKVKPLSPEHRARFLVMNIGRVHSEQTRRNMAAARRRMGPLSENTKKKLSDFWKGKPKSAETRAKMSQAHRRA